MENRYLDIVTETNDEHENYTDKFIKKIKEHKKEIILGAVAVAVTLGTFVILKSEGRVGVDLIEITRSNKIYPNYFKSNNRVVSEALSKDILGGIENIKPININAHVRNLPSGWNASPNKIISAIDNGILLGKNQTWVGSYTKLSA